MARFTTLLVLCSCLLCIAPPVAGGDIHRAIQAGDSALVAQILERDPGAASRPDEEDPFRSLPIHIAASVGNVGIARLLLDAGAAIDAGDSDNSTALGVAAMRRHSEMVGFLIERGANVNHRDRKADCPLSFAVFGRDEGIIRQLIDAGADLYFRNPAGETLLHISAGRGLRDFVEHLLENGADIEASASWGGTPLVYAARRGHVEVVRLLLERGADPNGNIEQHVPPLFMAAWENRLECVRLLLEKGAAVDGLAFGGNTSLQFAAEEGHGEMVRLLIEHGAAVDHTNEDGGTALLKASARGGSDCVAALLEASADPNRGTDVEGRTALQLACIGGHLEAARLLVDHGADMNPPAPPGQKPLELARFYGHRELSELLAERGAEGDGPGRIDRSLSALGKIDGKEAVIWFLGQSGWAVKTRNHLLIFDYFSQGEGSPSAGLCNGHVDPDEIAGEKVAVFVSHAHGDHFTPAVFEWREHVGDITYFLGLEPREAPPYVYMPPRMEETHGGIDLTAISSTDAGVGMVVEVDGVTIFHAGDHANGRIGLMDEFTNEIDFLAAKGIRPDICFMGIRGCSLGEPGEVKEGIHYTLSTLNPRVFIPMHAGTEGHLYREFVDECRELFKSIQMVAPGNRGDHFVYSGGRISDPRPDGMRQARVR